MKSLKLVSLFMVLFSLASCSNDDEPKNLATDVTGSYAGYTVASSSYFSNMVASGQTVTITSSELNKVNISYQSSTWGNVTINGAEVKETGGSLTISGAGVSSMAHAGNAAKEYECIVEGIVVDKELRLTFSCPTVMGGLKIEFKQGEIPAEIVVPGTYKGYTEAKSAYFSGMMADNQTIVIAKNSDDTYKVAYISDTWGEFSIDKATVSLSDGKFALRGSGVTHMGMNGNIKEYACTFEGTIDPEKENPTFTFTVPSVMGGLSIVFLTGDMPATE